MFHEAQRRYHEKNLFSSDGYIRDMLKHYGDGGRAIKLPTVSDDNYRSAVQYRKSEQEQYAHLQAQLADAQRELKTSRSDAQTLATYCQEFLSRPVEKHDPSRPGLGSGSSVTDSGSGVLPPTESHTDDGREESIISSTDVSDEHTTRRSGVASHNNVTQRQDAVADGDEDGGSTDTGGASVVSEPDVDRPTDKHHTA
jgi:hypothetical protein